ncbi:MAG: carboxymuconolactone decarboxylase family protein [Acidimicrobiales bacterium]
MSDIVGDGGRRFGALPLDAMSPEQRAVADAILAGPRGSSTGVRGPFEALLHSPDLADAAQRVGEHVRFRSSIPRAFNEMAIIMTARRWTAQFEWHVHRQMAIDAGLDPEVADAIARGERPVLDADGNAVYEFAAQLLEEGGVTDEAWDAVVQRWGKRGAIDLIGAVGYYCLVSFILNVDRYPPPEGEAPLPPR